MQPTATFMQMVTAFCAVVVAATAITFTVHNWADTRNAQLVQIGIGVLEIDPKKEPQAAAAREWAIQLVETNSGLKFSNTALGELLNRPFVIAGGGYATSGTIGPGSGSGTMGPSSTGIRQSGGYQGQQIGSGSGGGDPIHR